MCTVTYLRTKYGYILTSNRDEKNTRSFASLPAIYNIDDSNLIFPKDADKAGTWIVLKQNGDSLCLLNGAFENFTQKQSYLISRGIIVTKIAAQPCLVTAFKHSHLQDVAPFTLIIIFNMQLYECRWDGQNKFCKTFNHTINHIWSSATLYDDLQQRQREEWFTKWFFNPKLTMQENILNFHKNAGNGNPSENLMMNRNNEYATVSITSIEINENHFSMHYIDLINQKSSKIKF